MPFVVAEETPAGGISVDPSRSSVFTMVVFAAGADDAVASKGESSLLPGRDVGGADGNCGSPAVRTASSALL